ncbi:MAG TPA: hypothetical protein VHL11_09570 [Phototrophicaceae bacterium]|nr:hypothetical protein [Phototrophicaceae bacterium]
MKIIERIASIVGLDVTMVPRPELVELRNVVDEGRQRKRTEMYDEALKLFDRALELARQFKERSSIPIIQLHRTDVLIKQQRWDEATRLLQDLEAEARLTKESIQLAYTLTTAGTMYQAKGDLVIARRYYEQGLETARTGKSAGAEGRALGHLADLYLLDGNASYAVHLLRDSLEKLNNSNDVELSSYFVGRLGEALIQSGQTQEGDPLLTRALRLAQHMNYRPFERLWHLALARRATAESRYTEAYNHYERTLMMLRSNAAELPEVLRELSRICLNLNKNTTALTHAQRALDINPNDPISRGTMGLVLHASGQSEEALPYLEQAIAYGDQHPHDLHVEFLRMYAASLSDTGQVEAAAAAFEKALKTAHKAGNPLEEARVLRDRGTFFARHRQAQAAIRSWSDAANIYEGQGFHAQVARLYCDCGGLRMYLGQGQRAMKDYEQALMVLSSVNDQETRGIVLANAATAYVDQGDIDTAESFLTEAIKIAQKLQDRQAEATRRGNYGWFLLATGRAQRSLSALEYALRLSEGLQLTLAMAVQTDNLGLAHGELGLDEEALTYHNRALKLIEESENPHWKAVLQSNLAAQLIKMGHLDEVPALLQAIQTEAAELESYEITTRLLINQARLALKKDEPTTLETATAPIQEAINLARRAGTRRLLADALLVQSQYYARINNLPRATATWEEASKLLESLRHPDGNMPPAWLRMASDQAQNSESASQ